ncbi:enoyl-CoA hydratase/isomerase family protein [Lapillicoccus jejuensis]|uniref:Enoyl-CoA hydratase/carnithine racemase n=1 Tax=Lapillicoccus jejuensis TaxID=402171 RepID=A0A542E4B0_9MICO|nr:enoyl-CoA hydratase/isomerase family protein [Lapillicoccus jejuensis]TQJ10188.1 enoyl-CoA hydratase/carnithine racemase [Lapillicoccus jejuensis]
MSTEAASPHPWLRVERGGPGGVVRTVTLANPAERNAMTPSLWRALAQVAEQTPDDVRVVVLRGEGRSFCAGLHRALLTPGGLEGEDDMLAVAGSGQEAAEAMIEQYQAGFTAWSRLPAVVVAAVQGHAIGGGFQLALAADLRVVADDVQLAMRETALGMVPDLAGTSPLVHLVGYAHALEICATGRYVGAEEAHALGLANVIAPAGGLDAAVEQVVGALLAAPAAALRELKPLLRHAVDAAPEDQQALERRTNARLLGAMARGAGPSGPGAGPGSGSE